MNIPLPRAKRRARIEIIPLIDIIFFLLATFVMVSLSMVKNRGIGVHLPKAQTATQKETGEQSNFTVITVTENGEIYMNKQKIAPGRLTDSLKELKSRKKDPAILLNGDENALLGKVIYILDEARKIGIHRFAFGTRQS